MKYRIVIPLLALATAILSGGAIAQGRGGARIPRLPFGRPFNSIPRGFQPPGLAVAQSARRTAGETLIRQNRQLIEADPNGEPLLRGQLVALGLSDAALGRITAAGFTVVREQQLTGLNFRLDVLRSPPRLSTRRALRMLRGLDANATFDFDHLYAPSAMPAETTAGDDPGPVASSSPGSAPLVSSGSARVGLIDGGVQRTHPAFKHDTLMVWGCNGRLFPSTHGTAVASLLVGNQPPFHGSAPGATLYAADVYCGLPTGGSIDAIAEALGWMSASQVPVINISLVGPDNIILRQLVSQMIARGYLIVAAVGNDGPAAAPLYPAAYPGVVGVTAVDAHRRLLFEDGRGSQVAFAAPGADMVAAALPDGYTTVRGTSFAAPLVAGLLARQLTEPNEANAHLAIAALVARATHVGRAGRNPNYGFGVVGQNLRIAPDIMQARTASAESSTH